MIKAGDKVICINNEYAENYLTKGKVYKVIQTNTNRKILVNSDENFELWFGKRKFKPIKE